MIMQFDGFACAENSSSLARLCEATCFAALVLVSVHCDLQALAWITYQMLSAAHKGLSDLFWAPQAIQSKRSFPKPMQ